jgi:hypothetical protein
MSRRSRRSRPDGSKSERGPSQSRSRPLVIFCSGVFSRCHRRHRLDGDAADDRTAGQEVGEVAWHLFDPTGLEGLRYLPGERLIRS